MDHVLDRVSGRHGRGRGCQIRAALAWLVVSSGRLVDERREDLRRARRRFLALSAGVALVGCGAGGDAGSEPVLDIQVLARDSYRIGEERFDIPEDLEAWRTRLEAMAESSAKAPFDDQPDAPAFPTLRIAIHSEPEVRFVGVRKLMGYLAAAQLGRIELVTKAGEAIPIPLPYDTGVRDRGNRWRYHVRIALIVSTTEPRRAECAIGLRKVADLAELRTALESRPSRPPLKEITIGTGQRILYGDVIAVLDTIRAADIPPVTVAFDIPW